MSFIRPEARENLWRWREALAGLVATLLGVWMAMEGRGFVTLLGIIAMAAGIGLAIAGWQRARFRRGRDGVGVVSIVEGQITYFGPFTGGTMTQEMISELTLNPLPRSGPVWELRNAQDEVLRIPVDADGAEALFDVFNSLPDLGTEDFLSALKDPGPVPRVLWTRRRLH